jgi:hypothetical protein
MPMTPKWISFDIVGFVLSAFPSSGMPNTPGDSLEDSSNIQEFVSFRD